MLPYSARVLLATATFLLLSGRPGAGQEPDTVEVVEQPIPLQETVQLPEPDEPTTPGGAFLRAVLLPGWGHASIGSYTRGGFYFAAESATAWMIVRTVRRKSAAADVRDMREAALRERLRSQGITDPAEIEAALDEDEAVDDARDLVDAREQQFEDWLALGIFLVFLSGADAFVSGHLMDFPEPVEVGFVPVPGGVEVGVRIPVGGASR